MPARRFLGSVAAVLFLGSACAPSVIGSEWPPLAKKWFDRAQASYHQVDFDDAALAIDNALRIEPHREEVRLLAARVALGELDYDRAIRSLEGIDSSEARAIRGRAFWYSGQVERAADELEQLVADPTVRDPWATEVGKLARRGAGRKPFQMSGGILAVSEISPGAGGFFIVPLDLDGEPLLGLIATGMPEVMVDSASGRQPSWVSLRFNDRIDVKDVPALTMDMSRIRQQLNAPIRVLLGANLLRHVRPTVDFEGSQFIVRSYDPPPPPRATTVHLNYIRGGGMVFRTNLGGEGSAGSLLVDSAVPYPVALDDGGWKKAGITVASLQPVPNDVKMKQGLLPRMVLGAFDVPSVPGVYGSTPLDSIKEFERGLDVDLDGLIGAALLAAFRVTLADGGRTLWLEDTTMPSSPGAAPPGGGPPRGPAAPAPAPAPAPSATPPS
jgi:hypothetical protein